jgi:hypothetical protein
MADDFSERYGDLLTGSYDCVDRIVLNAYFPVGHNPGGFWCWWRRLHGGSDDDLDSTHLMRFAGRFARRVKAWANANGVPVIYCKAGERKHLIAGEHLAARPPSRLGVFLVLAAKAPASVWEVRCPESTGVIGNIAKKTAYVNRYSFHIMDPAWGHVTIKMSGHPPSRRRSSSTAMSTSRPPPGRRASISSRRAAALLASRIRSAWPRSQIPCRSTRL